VGTRHAGLLDDRQHTSNAREYLASSGYGRAAHYVEARAVTDRSLITASAAGALEFAKEIFLELN
jgi:hypothetical protein